MNRWLAMIAVISAFAQTSVAPPSIGVVRDSSGDIRPVVGTSGYFILGEPVIQSAISAAFSGRAGLVKTDSEVLVLDAQLAIIGRSDAPPGPAVFSFTDAGAPAFAKFPSNGETLQFTNDPAVSILPIVEGQEIVAPDGRRIRVDFNIDSLEQMSRNWIAVRESGGTRIFALRLDQKDLRLYQLPEAAQQ